MIKKPTPKGGSGNKEYQETKALWEQKRRLYKGMMNKAEHLLDAGKTAESRQCLTTARELDDGIKQLENLLDPERTEPETKTILKGSPRIVDAPPFPGWPIMRKNEQDELETIGRMNDTTVLRRRTV